MQQQNGKAPRIFTKLRIIPLVSETQLCRDGMVQIRSGDGVKGGREMICWKMSASTLYPPPPPLSHES